MAIKSDRELLDDYVTFGSELAFEELVGRHARMVYATCLRGCPRHAAEDASQAVFVLLARKAHSLSSRVVVAGWLYQTARRVAAVARRQEQLRRHHEMAAAQLKSVLQDADDRPPIDLERALDSLHARDRNAILLRFYENRSYKEVGCELGSSEEAAKKRVARALEKLRKFLRLHASEELVSVLSAVTALDLPDGFQRETARAALSHPPHVLKPAVRLLTANARLAVGAFKAKLVASLLVLVGTAVTLAALALSDTRADEPTDRISGVVVLDGKPISGARVELAYKDHAIRVLPKLNGEEPGAPSWDGGGHIPGRFKVGLSDGRDAVVTGPDGKFSMPFPPAHKPYRLVVRAEAGFAEAGAEELSNDPTVRLQPWGRVEGTFMVNDKPAANQIIYLSRYPAGGNERAPEKFVIHDAMVTTDKDGHFLIARFAPGVAWLTNSRSPASRRNFIIPVTQFMRLEVRSGEPTHVLFGGRGVTVTGRAKASPTLSADSNQASLRYEGTALLLPLPQTPPGEEPRFYYCTDAADFRPDGSFRLIDIRPGRYRLVITAKVSRPGDARPTVTKGTMDIEVPQPAEGAERGSLTLGDIPVEKAASAKDRAKHPQGYQLEKRP